MKEKLFLVLFTISMVTFSQEKKEKRFYTASIHSTFALNPDYVLFDKEDGENLLDFSAILIRNGLGYRFTKKWTGSINFGIDFHTRLGLQSLPAYFSVEYNLFEDGDDNLFFVNSSIGKLWKPSSNFDKGDYYSLGLGWQIGGGENVNTLLKLDFHRKKILGLNNGNLDSVSFGLGITLF